MKKNQNAVLTRKKNQNAVPALVTFLIVLLCLAAFSPQRAHATNSTTTYTEGYFKYVVEDGGVAITGYFGKASEVTVPAQIAGNPVYKVVSGAFADCSTVTQVNLPASIMTIEEGAFSTSQTVFYYDSSGNVVSAGGSTMKDEEGDDPSGDGTSTGSGDDASDSSSGDSSSDSDIGSADASDSGNQTDSADGTDQASAGDTSNGDSAVDAAEAALANSDSGDDHSNGSDDAAGDLNAGDSDVAAQADGDGEDSANAGGSSTSDDAEESGGSWYQRIFSNMDVSATVTFAEILLIVLIPVLLLLAGLGFYRSRKRGQRRMRR